MVLLKGVIIPAANLYICYCISGLALLLAFLSYFLSLLFPLESIFSSPHPKESKQVTARPNASRWAHHALLPDQCPSNRLSK